MKSRHRSRSKKRRLFLIEDEPLRPAQKRSAAEIERVSKLLAEIATPTCQPERSEPR